MIAFRTKHHTRPLIFLHDCDPSLPRPLPPPLKNIAGRQNCATWAILLHHTVLGPNPPTKNFVSNPHLRRRAKSNSMYERFLPILPWCVVQHCWCQCLLCFHWQCQPQKHHQHCCCCCMYCSGVFSFLHCSTTTIRTINSSVWYQTIWCECWTQNVSLFPWVPTTSNKGKQKGEEPTGGKEHQHEC